MTGSAPAKGNSSDSQYHLRFEMGIGVDRSVWEKEVRLRRGVRGWAIERPSLDLTSEVLAYPEIDVRNSLWQVLNIS